MGAEVTTDKQRLAEARALLEQWLERYMSYQLQENLRTSMLDDMNRIRLETLEWLAYDEKRDDG